eukprot:snap_masked-scaffold_10-processed-gene-4.43-mRNA-1 protein AED:1.00 eAED:1.00 QI:0/-1/0/0/-1/1/1/0/277
MEIVPPTPLNSPRNFGFTRRKQIDKKKLTRRRKRRLSYNSRGEETLAENFLRTELATRVRKLEPKILLFKQLLDEDEEIEQNKMKDRSKPRIKKRHGRVQRKKRLLSSRNQNANLRREGDKKQRSPYNYPSCVKISNFKQKKPPPLSKTVNDIREFTKRRREAIERAKILRQSRFNGTLPPSKPKKYMVQVKFSLGQSLDPLSTPRLQKFPRNNTSRQISYPRPPKQRRPQSAPTRRRRLKEQPFQENISQAQLFGYESSFDPSRCYQESTFYLKAG